MPSIDMRSLRPATIAGGRFDRYFHTCAFVRSRDEEYRILAPFVGEGLLWGEKAIYIVDPAIEHEHASRLKAAGVDVASHQGQWQMLTWRETYLKDGKFDKEQMMAAVEGTIQAGLEQGFARSRIVGQMGWAVQGHPGSDKLIEYEVEVNEVLARTRHPAVCVYDINKLSGTLMMDLMRAHPMTIVGGVVYENPFYVPAETMLREVREREASASV